MHMVPVVSDNVAFVGYDHATRILRVTFHSGGTYDYYERPCLPVRSHAAPAPLASRRPHDQDLPIPPDRCLKVPRSASTPAGASRDRQPNLR